jgi:NtrC-family two-component system sensor histidine kinase KinB
MRRRLLGLRTRFLAAGVLLVLTTVAAGAWTLFVLSRLALVAATTVRDTAEVTAASAAAASALEREDDALLVILGGAERGREALDEARSVTDRARDRLRHDSSSRVQESLASELDATVLAYRTAVDAVIAAPGDLPLERYHRQANPRLRLAVTAVSKARDQRFEEARAATALARDEVSRARDVVILISLLAVAIAAGVALRLARHVTLPMRQLAQAAEAIRDGHFDTRVETAPGDEIGDVAEAFNDMARRLADFQRSNLGEVLRAKRALEATMQALPDAVLLIDAGGRVASINPAAAQLFRELGTSPPMTIADLAQLGPPSSRFQEALLGQQALDRVDLDAALRIEIGSDVRRLVPRIVPLLPGQEQSGVVLVLSDVTELARLDEMRTELVAVASHELRTPVTTLRMSLLMLREAADTLDHRIRDLVQTALGGVDQLRETVDELLDMTRIEAGQLKLSTEPVDVGHLVREVTNRSLARAKELELSLEVHAADDLPPVIGDPARLRIVVDNIVNNALKYAPRHGTILIQLLSHSNRHGRSAIVEVAVTDTGPGIPAEFRSRAFEKFFRVEHYRPGSEEAPRGSGIGLYLCKEIVEAHGGTIRCEAPPEGHGARIVFALPIRRANA